jgi:calcineurin-like phosphoesterase family protein
MPNIFFTADQHYYSPSIIRVCNRPFSSVEEMNSTLIERHNAVVKPGDLVYNIGDMFLGKRSGPNKGLESARSLRRRLNGQHYLLEGNHDELAVQMPEAFVWIRHYARLRSKGLPEGCPDIVLCHYALRTWEKRGYGSWHLYGHSHGNLPEDGSLSFDVGVDCWDFRPVSIEEVAAKMKRLAGTAELEAKYGDSNLDHLPEGSH